MTTDIGELLKKIRLQLFSDRIEIFSPGDIPNTLSIETLPLRQVTSNEVLTSVLSRCPIRIHFIIEYKHFLMERRGDGVPIILSESKRVSNKLPVYKLLDDEELLLTIYAA